MLSRLGHVTPVRGPHEFFYMIFDDLGRRKIAGGVEQDGFDFTIEICSVQVSVQCDFAFHENSRSIALVLARLSSNVTITSCAECHFLL